jgi:hypothetical protein
MHVIREANLLKAMRTAIVASMLFSIVGVGSAGAQAQNVVFGGSVRLVDAAGTRIDSADGVVVRVAGTSLAFETIAGGFFIFILPRGTDVRVTLRERQPAGAPGAGLINFEYGDIAGPVTDGSTAFIGLIDADGGAFVIGDHEPVVPVVHPFSALRIFR